MLDYKERTVPQNYIYDGLINHQTGEVGFGSGYGMTQAGINPIEPCCGTPMGMAMSPTMLALNGNEAGVILNGQPSYVFGVGIFSVGGGSVGGGDVAPIIPINGTTGAPITIAGGRVLSAVEDPPEYPIGGALLVIVPGTPAGRRASRGLRCRADRIAADPRQHGLRRGSGRGDRADRDPLRRKLRSAVANDGRAQRRHRFDGVSQWRARRRRRT